MTNLEVFEGNDKTFNVTITISGTGLPLDITGYKFLFTVKNNINDLDSNAIISKDITSHVIPASGTTTIPILRADTLNQVGNKFYDYQWCTSGAQLRKTIMNGNFIIKQSVGDRDC